jgi:hypothetical protein
MININYQPTHTEIGQATLDFFLNRPMMRIMLHFMRVACVLLCVIFAMFWHAGQTRPKDYVFASTALIWLLYYKQLNKKLINATIKRQNVSKLPHNFNVDNQRIYCQDQNSQIEWKKIKFILKNVNGYIIPLTGFTNAGKFLWFPNHGFANQASEQNFVELMHKLSKKIKTIKSA